MAVLTFNVAPDSVICAVYEDGGCREHGVFEVPETMEALLLRMQRMARLYGTLYALTGVGVSLATEQDVAAEDLKMALQLPVLVMTSGDETALAQQTLANF
jgi:hypothetical protein